MSKYLITLEVESDNSPDELIKPSWGALIVDASHNWEVIDVKEIEGE